MTQNHLKELAEVVGWTKVNDDKGYSVYEYNRVVNKYESVSNIVKILEEPTEFEVYEILLALKAVLPKDLQRKINKIIRDVKIENLPQIVEVVSFAVDEYKQKAEFTKLKIYGELAGVDIEKLGYKFQYKLIKKQAQEIISKIERNFPMEIAPLLGKIRKLDYKIAFVRNKRNLEITKEE